MALRNWTTASWSLFCFRYFAPLFRYLNFCLLGSVEQALKNTRTNPTMLSVLILVIIVTVDGGEQSCTYRTTSRLAEGIGQSSLRYYGTHKTQRARWS